MSLDCVIYCVFYSILFRGAVFSRTRCISFTQPNPTSPERQQAAYDCQFLILGSERHLLMFPHHWILHAEQTHKQPQQSNMAFHLRHLYMICVYLADVNDMLFLTSPKQKSSCKKNNIHFLCQLYQVFHLKKLLLLLKYLFPYKHDK